ncbi:MAG: hypothetical protein J0M26_20870, partial [Planctomycetes bacterium]|nr:hypothetical protein [Planctomycetota bacterium]
LREPAFLRKASFDNLPQIELRTRRELIETSKPSEKYWDCGTTILLDGRNESLELATSEK